MENKILRFILELLTGLLLSYILVYSLEYMNNQKLNLNFDLSLNSKSESNVLSKIDNLSSSEYKIRNMATKKFTEEDEKKIIRLTNSFVKSFDNWDEVINPENIYRYFVRKEEVKLDNSKDQSPNVLSWYSRYEELNKLIKTFELNDMHYEKIKDIKVSFSSNNFFISEAYLSNISIKKDNKTVLKDGVFSLEIVYEKKSNMFKINRASFELVEDYQTYINNKLIKERYVNRNKLSTLDSYSSYLPKFNTSYNYQKNINKDVVNRVYNRNKDSVVIIEGVNESGIGLSNMTGFYVRSGVIMTSWNSLLNLINNNAKRYFAINTLEEVNNISGIISVYPDLNIVLLKTTEETGKAVTISNKELTKEENILSISSPNGLKQVISSGIYIGTLDSDLKTIRTSLPLTEGEIGSPIFNTNGEVIGINSLVSSKDYSIPNSFNVASSITYFEGVISKLENNNFNDIEVVSFDTINSNIATEVVNEVSDKVWEKYNDLPTITNNLPVKLSSAHKKSKYTIFTYINDSLGLITDEEIINSYSKYLLKNNFVNVNTDTYSRDKITLRIKKVLGKIVIIVEGL